MSKMRFFGTGNSFLTIKMTFENVLYPYRVYSRVYCRCILRGSQLHAFYSQQFNIHQNQLCCNPDIIFGAKIQISIQFQKREAFKNAIFVVHHHHHFEVKIFLSSWRILGIVMSKDKEIRMAVAKKSCEI